MGSLGCASDGPWCLVTIPERGEVCKANFVDGSVSLVASGLSGGEGLAVIRQDKEFLLSGQIGLVQISIEDGSRRVLLESWPDDSLPDSVAVDERGSGVFGREQGLAIAYFADSDTARVFSVDLSSHNQVVDSRLAFATSLPLDITFDSARGEVLVADPEGVVVSNPRVLGDALPVPKLVVSAATQNNHFLAIEWLGPAHGAVLDGLDRVDRIEQMRSLVETYSGMIAFSDLDGVYLLTVPSQRTEEIVPVHKVSNVTGIRNLAKASGDPCDFVGYSSHSRTLDCFRFDGLLNDTLSIQIPDDGCQGEEGDVSSSPTPLWPLYTTQIVWETDAPTSLAPSTSSADNYNLLPTTTMAPSSLLRPILLSTNSTKEELPLAAANQLGQRQSSLVTGLTVLGLVAVISCFVRRLRQRRGERGAVAYAVLSQDDAWDADKKRRGRHKRKKKKGGSQYEEIMNQDDDDNDGRGQQQQRGRKSSGVKKKKKKSRLGHTYEFVDANDDSELEDTDEGIFV